MLLKTEIMKSKPISRRAERTPLEFHRALAVALALASSGSLHAQERAASSGASAVAPSQAAEKKPTAFDQIWRNAQLYKDESNPYIQGVSFTGRFQLDYAVIESNREDHDEWNIRRFRVGGKSKLFHDFTLHGEVEIDPQEGDPVYQRITDLYLSWSRSPSFEFTIGKHSAPFTADGWTSSKELLAIDRSNLANNFWYPEEYIPGVSASGEIEKWTYHLGVYSSGERDKEFGEFNGGYFTLASVGHDFAEALGAKQALLRLDYVYNEPDANNTFTRSLQHVASLNFSYNTGKWGVRTDVSAGEGFLGQSDLWGAMVMPFYNITDKFQAVARYTFLDSEDPNGIRFARYESVPQVMGGRRGDEYHEFYVGLNYYAYGHKLKLQTGVHYADMRDRADDGGDYSGWGWTTGLRISW